MALIRWEPKAKELEPLHNLRDEVDRLFEDFIRGWPRPWGGWLSPFRGGEVAAPGYAPNVDMKETETDVLVTAEVPGFNKENLEVVITENSVTLKGERKEEKKEKKGDTYHYREVVQGSFERVLALPAAVVADKAKAELKDGVLTLTLPKTEPSKRKTLKVKID